MIQAVTTIACAETTYFPSEKTASCDPADRHGRLCTGMPVLKAAVYDITLILQDTVI